MIPDWYEWRAQVPPTLILTVPLVLIWLGVPVSASSLQLQGLLTVKVAGSITVAVVVLYPGMQLVRWLGVLFVEKRLFKSSLTFPSQTLLTHKNTTLDPVYKERVRAAIETDFGTTLMTQREEDMTSMARLVEFRAGYALPKSVLAMTIWCCGQTPRMALYATSVGVRTREH